MNPATFALVSIIFVCAVIGIYLIASAARKKDLEKLEEPAEPIQFSAPEEKPTVIPEKEVDPVAILSTPDFIDDTVAVEKPKKAKKAFANRKPRKKKTAE